MSTHKIEGILAIIAAILVIYVSTLNAEAGIIVSVVLFVILAAWDLSR